MADSLDMLEEEEAVGWITTYADLVTLLLVFFVLLYSMSSLDIEKFKVALESIQISLGEATPSRGLMEFIEVPETLDTEVSIEKITGLKKKDKDEEIVKDISQFIQQKRMGEHIVLQVMDGKVIIRIRGKVLFQSGKAKLNRLAYPILDEIVSVVDEYYEYSVNIKGHTDNVPISSDKFPSNWELSAVRATTVLKYLIRRGISPSRLTATGYGEVLPLVPNNTAENRSTNRRVEFVLEREEF